MKRTCVYTLFGSLLLLLAIHFQLSRMGIEPYPAFFYPAFSNVSKRSDKLDVIKPEFTVTYQDGTKQIVDYYKLFDNIPISHVNHLVVNHLNPTRKFDPTRFQDKPLKSFQLGRYIYEFQRTPLLPSKQETEQRKHFFRDRIFKTTLNPSPASKLSIIWYQYEFVFGKGWIKTSRTQTYETTLDLS